jgi:hypothetical protein
LLLRRNTVGFFVFSWTGFYIGANIGGAWANNWTDNWGASVAARY